MSCPAHWSDQARTFEPGCSSRDGEAELRHRLIMRGDRAFDAFAAAKVAMLRQQLAPAPKGRAGSASALPAGATIEHFVLSLRMLEHERPDHPGVRALRRELEGLGAVPVSRRG